MSEGPVGMARVSPGYSEGNNGLASGSSWKTADLGLEPAPRGRMEGFHTHATASSCGQHVHTIGIHEGLSEGSFTQWNDAERGCVVVTCIQHTRSFAPPEASFSLKAVPGSALGIHFLLCPSEWPATQ